MMSDDRWWKAPPGHAVHSWRYESVVGDSCPKEGPPPTPSPPSAKAPFHIWTFLLLVWVLTLVLISDMQHLLHHRQMQRGNGTWEVAVASPLRVAVYYEALCPDSRHFVSRQLVPGYDVIGDIISVDLIPYGKAQSQILSDGRKKFRCQHGPQECKANAVHACVSKHVRDERRRMQVVKCMIDLNSRRSDVVQDGKKCVTEYEDEDWSVIEKCSLGEEGEELLFHMGKMTDDLDPKVSFIPTITINDKQDHQALILKNFVKGVCEAYSGPAHSACGT